MNSINLNERVLKTLKIAEKRGYNLTIDKLAVGLIGGEIDIDVLYEKIKNFDNIDFDGEFVATSGNLDTKKCKNRMNSNEKLQNSYLKIAQRYSLDFQRICPFVKCIMITGSIVTDGLTNDDDIDFNFIVQDNTKYTSYLLAILLSLKYSIKYRKQFKQKYIHFLTKVICISIIWEEHQVLSFIRKDEQIVYELFNSIVLYNQSFFNKMLDDNIWLKKWFPQIYHKTSVLKNNNENIHSNGKKPSFLKILDRFSFETMFFLFKIIKISRLKNHTLRKRMDLVEKVKHPYGLFDIPNK